MGPRPIVGVYELSVVGSLRGHRSTLPPEHQVDGHTDGTFPPLDRAASPGRWPQLAASVSCSLAVVISPAVDAERSARAGPRSPPPRSPIASLFTRDRPITWNCESPPQERAESTGRMIRFHSMGREKIPS